MRRNNFTRGLVAGTLVGATVAMMMNPMEEKDRRRLKKRSTRTMRHMGDIIGDAVEEFLDMRR